MNMIENGFRLSSLELEYLMRTLFVGEDMKLTEQRYL